MIELLLLSLLQRLLAVVIPYLQQLDRKLENLLHRNRPDANNSSVVPVVLTAKQIDSQALESFPPGTDNDLSWRTLISRSRTPTDTLTVGKATLPPQTGQLCAHRHQQAEVYHILSGRGLVTLGDSQREVGEGDVVFIPGNEIHAIKNSSDKAELTWMYYFACDGFEDVKYRF